MKHSIFPRLRQVALVARNLEPVVATLTDVLGLEISLRDPNLRVFGLQNAVMPVGNQFLEVVSPIQPDTTAGRFLDRRRGDGGYMVIVQTGDGDLSTDRDRLQRIGVRVVWEVELDDIATLHLHPRDVGAAILSLDVARPAESWRWAGDDWQRHVRTDVIGAITGVEMQTERPEHAARRWVDVLGIEGVQEKDNGFEVLLSNATLRFTPLRDDRGDGIHTIEVSTNDRKRAIEAARQAQLPIEDGAIGIGGVWFRLTRSRP